MRSARSRHHQSGPHRPGKPDWDLRFASYVGPVSTRHQGYTCAADGRVYETLDAIKRHDDRAHGSARVTSLPGRWEDEDLGWQGGRR